MRIEPGRKASTILLSFILLWSIADADAARRPRPKPRPVADLVISEARLTSSEYVFKDEAATFTFSDRTKNIARVRSRRSTNTLVAQGPLRSGIEVVLARRSVPALRKGQSHAGEGSETYTVNLPVGAYDLLICTDRRIATALHAHSCATLEKGLFVAKRKWTGSVTGRTKYNSLDGVSEEWRSNELVFNFSRYIPRGRFEYIPAGTLTYTVSGTADGGCTYNGSGVGTAIQGVLAIDHLNEHYEAKGAALFTYPIIEDCGIATTATGPSNGAFLFTSTTAASGTGLLPLPFALATLSGEQSDPLLDATNMWNWQ